MHYQRMAWGLFLMGLLALAGCAGDNMAEVKGMVKVNGTPIEKGAMTFYPVDGKSPTTGCGIKDGQYDCQVPFGTMKVAISMPQVYMMKKLYPNDPKSPEAPMSKESLPAKYNAQSELKIDVKPGLNEKDFELVTK